MELVENTADQQALKKAGNLISSRTYHQAIPGSQLAMSALGAITDASQAFRHV
jgi:hypothetical protein